MTSALLAAAILALVIFVGMAGLRRFPYRVRIAFDAVCFVVISALLFHKGVKPLFPALHGPIAESGLWLRVVAGGWWFLVARVLIAMLWLVLHRNRQAHQARLFSDLAAGCVYIATAVLVLNSVFALPVTGLVATSGVLAIVLGLALQNTLADVFSGIAVGIEAPFSIGDRIRVAGNFEGEVVQVNWRSIRIATDSHDIAILPHSAVAKAEIVNLSFPCAQRGAVVEIPCRATAAPERVLEALREAILLCPSVMRAPAPTVRLARLGKRWNLFEIAFCVESTAQLGPTRDALLVLSRRQLRFSGLLDAALSGSEPAVVSSERFLAAIPLFERLPPATIARLAAEVRQIALAPDDVLFEQGDVDASVYLLLSGVLELCRRREDGVVSRLGCIGAGEYVGEIGLLTGAEHAASATALTHVLAYRLDKEGLAPLLATQPELAAAFARSAARGLTLIERDIAAQATVALQQGSSLLARIRAFFLQPPPR